MVEELERAYPVELLYPFEGSDRVTTFHLSVDARGDGALLGTREVYVVIPRTQGSP